MAERKSSLFPNKKKRPVSKGMTEIEQFNDTLKSNLGESTVAATSPLKKETKKLTNPQKSHKGKAGRKAEYDDPRLKKDQNTKISLSTKLRIQRLISRKFDSKSEGDVIDIALDYLVSSFDRDDRDSLFKAYREDMESVKPVIDKKNEKLKAAGKNFLVITDDIDKKTLQEQKEKWVSAKFE